MPDLRAASTYAPVRTVPWPDARAGDLLVPGGDGPEGLATFRAHHPEVPGPDADTLVDLLRSVDLRGRGGAGFPAWRKLAAVADGRRRGPVVLVANGEEGEPASAKDRYLLRHRPHAVLDGLDTVRSALDADQTWVYVSDPVALDVVRVALAERGDTATGTFLAPQGYVSGEETSVVRALEGGPALPVQKPPRPFEAGVGGLPTAVFNVETLARAGLVWSARVRGEDPHRAADRLLLTVLDDRRVVLTEAPRGTTLRSLARHCLDLELPPGTPVLAGGFFSGFLPPASLDLGLDHDAFRAAGTGVGCGSFAFLPDRCPVELATDVMAFFDRENAHQCGSCFKGTAAMHAALSRIGTGTATDTDVPSLARWSTTLPGRGSCATLDGAACLARTLLDQFAGAVADHQHTPCPQCLQAHELGATDTRLRVPAP